MTDNEAYVATLARMERDLAKAEAVAAKLRTGIAAIKDIIEADAGMVSANGTSHAAHPTQTMLPGMTPPVAMTMKDAAIAILRRAGRPLKVREIFDGFKEIGFDYRRDFETFRGSMTPTLDRRPEFKKVGAGLYAVDEEYMETMTAQGAGSTLGGQ